MFWTCIKNARIVTVFDGPEAAQSIGAILKFFGADEYTEPKHVREYSQLETSIYRIGEDVSDMLTIYLEGKMYMLYKIEIRGSTLKIKYLYPRKNPVDVDYSADDPEVMSYLRLLTAKTPAENLKEKIEMVETKVDELDKLHSSRDAADAAGNSDTSEVITKLWDRVDTIDTMVADVYEYISSRNTFDTIVKKDISELRENVGRVSDEADAKTETVARDVNAIAARLDEVSSAISKLNAKDNAERDEFRKERDEFRKERDEFRKERDEFRKEHNEFKQEYMENKITTRNLYAKVDWARRDINTLSIKIDEINETIGALHMRIDDIAAKEDRRILTIRSDVNELDDRFDEMDNDIGELLARENVAGEVDAKIELVMEDVDNLADRIAEITYQLNEIGIANREPEKTEQTNCAEPTVGAETDPDHDDAMDNIENSIRGYSIGHAIRSFFRGIPINAIVRVMILALGVMSLVATARWLNTERGRVFVDDVAEITTTSLASAKQFVVSKIGSLYAYARNTTEMHMNFALSVCKKIVSRTAGITYSISEALGNVRNAATGWVIELRKYIVTGMMNLARALEP